MLINLLVLVIVLGIVWWIVSLLPLPAPFKNIALVIVLLIALFAALGLLGVGPGIGALT